MRLTRRLLASVSTYLEAGAPTGITGLFTHAAPRSALLYLYSTTLDKLKTYPESSVYRQSCEALTRHRMSIVESIQPAGLSEWQERVSKLVDAHPEAFRRVQTADGKGFNIVYFEPEPTMADRYRSEDDRVNAEYKRKPLLEGPRDEEEVAERGQQLARDEIGEEMKRLRIESEPPLTAEQVGEIEQQIGAGLIEEVIRVAEGEKRLAGVLGEGKVWEDLEEQPPQGQWVYNERNKS